MGKGYDPHYKKYFDKVFSKDNNVYVCVSSFIPGKHTFISRRKQNFVALHTVMVDDLGTKVSMDKLKLEPTWLIETSPGNYQAWYFLAEPVTDIDEAEWLIKRMVAEGLAAENDPGMLGVSRFGRLPCGINGKSKYTDPIDGEFIVRTALAHPDRRFTVSEIETAYALTDVPAPTTQTQFSPLPPGLPTAKPESGWLLDLLLFEGLVLPNQRKKVEWVQLNCPWSKYHTAGLDGAAYAPPSEANGWNGGFQCNHGHCIDKTLTDLIQWARKRIKFYEKKVRNG